jgi:hypothetical protein
MPCWANCWNPVVSLSVAVIIARGGLNLKISDIKNTTPVVLR